MSERKTLAMRFFYENDARQTSFVIFSKIFRLFGHSTWVIVKGDGYKSLELPCKMHCWVFEVRNEGVNTKCRNRIECHTLVIEKSIDHNNKHPNSVQLFKILKAL